MKIAIHHRPGSFSDIWVNYCREHSIPYKVVNAYDSDVVSQLFDCDLFMWHYHHANYRDALFAKQLLFSLQQSGKKVFPNFNTGWHFDDKLGQKYLFEAHGIKSAISWAFYDKKTAYTWIKQASFPKVFKLRGGAGSSNVRLVRTRREAYSLVRRAFGRGFPQYGGIAYVRESFTQLRSRKKSLRAFLRSCARLIIPNEFSRMHACEKGYVYFQDFVPNEGYDLRVLVVGHRACAVRRNVRKNDFRASGSGNFVYDKEALDERAIEYSFRISSILGTQTLALDYIFDDTTSDFYLCEVSFGHIRSMYIPCPGYWTEDMVWHDDPVRSVEWILEDMLSIP